MSNLSPANSAVGYSSRQAKQFLRFYLHPDTKVMLPVGQITEVVKLQLAQIVPIPQMPSWVMGVYNWRGEILWMVDLAHLLGLEPWYHNPTMRHHNAIVLSPARNSGDRSNNICLGLIVSRIEDLETCDTAQIQSSLNLQVSTQLGSFLQGYWLKPEGEMILTLDGKAIAAAMPRNSE